MRIIPVAKPLLGVEEAQAAYDAVLSGWVTQGPRVGAFEEAFARYVGTRYAVAVSSCTTALHLSLIVSGIGPGDEVICPSMSYIATANSIRYVGATPVFAEIDPHTYNLDIVDTESRITSRTKAILLVHQVGVPADIDQFSELAKRHGLMLIEDAACAIGSIYKQKLIGSNSDLVCFSFHPRKIVTTGDGGMITSNRQDYVERLKLLRQHGMSVNDRTRHEARSIIFEDHLELGYNYRMTDIQAAVGIKQLERLPEIIEERRAIAKFYSDSLRDLPFIHTLRDPDQGRWNVQSYVIRLLEGSPLSRDDLMRRLLKDGISSRRGIMTAHRETAYRNYMPGISLPISEAASDSSLVIPLYVPMAREDQEFVISRVRYHLGA